MDNHKTEFKKRWLTFEKRIDRVRLAAANMAPGADLQKINLQLAGLVESLARLEKETGANIGGDALRSELQKMG